jgi:hypothetical protein
MDKETKHQLLLIKKVISTLSKINKIDEILESKYDRNTSDLNLYQKMLNDINSDFHTIIINFQ